MARRTRTCECSLAGAPVYDRHVFVFYTRGVGLMFYFSFYLIPCISISKRRHGIINTMITQWAHAEAARGEQACKSFLLKQRHCLLSLWRRRRRRRRRRIHNCLVKRLQGGRRHAFIIAVITIPEPYPERAVRIHPKHCALSASGSTDHTIIFAEHLAYVGTCIVNTSVFFYTKKNKSSIKGGGMSGIRCHNVCRRHMGQVHNLR